jgi:predicted DNA-binding transcriptional regulator AlpA
MDGNAMRFRETSKRSMHEESSNMEGFMSIQDAVKLTGVSRVTLWRMMNNGTFPRAVPISRGRKGIPRDDVAAWIERAKAGNAVAPAFVRRPRVDARG